jgi:lipopolysaccharide heptosyltransferase II
MNNGNSAQWQSARNILCVRLDNMGDVLMCTPAMRAVRESAPGRRITLLTSSSGAAVAPFIPEIDDVLVYAPPWMKGSQPQDAACDMAMAQALRAGGFDAAIIFTTYSQSALPAALLCHLAGIPLRLAHCRENPYQLLTDWIPDPEPEHGVRHEVRRQLELVAAIACRTGDEHLSFAVREQDRDWMQRRLLAQGIAAGRPWVLMHPGATAQSRRYPAAHWSRLIAQLVADDIDIVLSGDSSETALIAGIVQEANAHAGSSTARVHAMAGQLDLGQLGAAISLASVLVSNNTGPAHMAAAIGTPLVDLYALTNPQHTPWQVASRVLFHDVPCRFCYKSICPHGHNDCLRKVEPSQVAAAVHSLLRAVPNEERPAAAIIPFRQSHERRAQGAAR